MSKEMVRYTTYLDETLARLADPGLLLVSQGEDGVPNAMTIGWGTVGRVWTRKMFTVLVRPSRHTFSRLEESDSFTVNVPPPSLHGAVDFCGTKSGRDYDKFAECNLTAEPSKTVATPGIAECPIIYECQVVHTNDVINASLDPEIVAGSYAGGDFHRIYYGEILAVRAAEDARAMLGME
jgi:flavin reductase (DIM6/NTAB) family NADH-FMN oxidoreductase RutF